MIEIIRKKRAHEPLEPKNVVNLIDALRRSVATEKPAAKPAKGKKRIAGQGEMLLPIAGKKNEAAKEVAKTATRRKAG
jgi:DNA end-binding protein Ku